MHARITYIVLVAILLLSALPAGMRDAANTAWLGLETSLRLVALITPAIADDGDDDDDGDDQGGGGGGGGGGGAAGATDPVPDELPGAFDDGDNIGPRDCFEESALLPPWLRRCEDAPTSPPVATPARVAPPAATRQVAREPANALARELVVYRATPAQIQQLEAIGFVIISRSDLAGGEVLRLSVPAGYTTVEAREVVRQTAPGAFVDFNHIYRPAQAGCTSLVCRQRRAIGWPEPPKQCAVEAALGMVDTSVDADNAALKGQSLEVLDGVSGGRPLASNGHGTAIAGLLVGRSEAPVPGLLPRGTLTAVQAFHRSASGEDIADTFDIVRALDVLVQQGKKVINLSFTGPNNQVLAQIVRESNAKDAVLVAAAGNLGPSGPVVYPAGYEDVVAVTAVGEDLRAYRGANRGAYIDFAAPGVNVEVVAAPVATRFETGTSFASPFMAAAVSVLRASDTSLSADALIAKLQTKATDLGRPGRDSVFGWGLVQLPDICP